jgi:hypothetical protein
MRDLGWVSLVSGSLLAFIGCASRQQASTAPPPAPVGFAGSWVLNRQDSDINPRRTGGRESRYGGGRFGGRRGGARGQQGGDAGQDTAMRAALRPAEHLVVNLTDSTVTITAGDLGSQLLPTDGRKVVETTADDRKIETRARWKDGSLRIERSLSDAFKITDVYTLSWSGNRLEDDRVVERSDRPGPRTALRLIYDRQPADST